MNEKNNSRHDQIKGQIVEACFASGFTAKAEYRGSDWRADVIAERENSKFIFEIQTTRQSLNQTLARQAKYIKDGIIGCWLLEKAPSKFSDERLDLPLFEIKDIDGRIFVSLKDRKDLPIEVFVKDYLQKRIKFCSSVVTTSKQRIEIAFVKMDYWKCGKENHIYFANSGFYSACNAKLHSEEMLWDSDKKEYRPEIVKYVREYANSEKGKKLNIGAIEERYSKTVGRPYVSFGCSERNSIFGDWFVHEAVMEAQYGAGVVEKTTCELEMDIDLRIKLPHWCQPGDSDFCE